VRSKNLLEKFIIFQLAHKKTQASFSKNHSMQNENKEQVFTENGALSNPITATDARLAVFYKATRGAAESAVKAMVANAARENLADTIVLAFYTRDPRGGKGERKLGRQMLVWLAANYPNEMKKVLPLWAEYGRFDDILHLVEKASPCSETSLQIFAAQLQADVKNMQDGKGVSLAAKWCPSEQSARDRRCHLATKVREALNKNMKPRTFRKNVLVPLRAYLDLVECLMCADKWPEIKYSKVPSRAMKILKDAFERHDAARFNAWKTKVVKGEAKINAKALFPHELVQCARKEVKVDLITEEQWKVLQEETRKLGVFGNTLVLSDVSGSMENPKGLPMNVSVAMGILISNCSNSPAFRDRVITFESSPQFHSLSECKTFKAKVQSLLKAPWGGSTNLQAAFDLILTSAQMFRIPADQMPRRLFIISDMQFDQAAGNQTNFQVMQSKFAQAGYAIPEVWFWNVAARTTPNEMPVCANEAGVVLISGFSPAILKSILTCEKLDPQTAMRAALDAERYAPVYQALRA